MKSALTTEAQRTQRRGDATKTKDLFFFVFVAPLLLCALGVFVVKLPLGRCPAMNLLTPEEVIAALGLEPHPLEGGFFRETYRTPQKMHGQERPLATAIYYLLTPETCSTMHRLP